MALRKAKAEGVVRSMRNLGLIEGVDEALANELVVLAKDLDETDRDSYIYPQLVRIYHELEDRLAERLLPSRGEDDEGQSLADRLAALGNPAKP